MLYEIAHVIKAKFGFLWDVVEWGNASLFSILYQKGLKEIPDLLKECSNETFTIRMTSEEDAPKLAQFFKEQPDEAYTFFKPHGFDEKSVLNVLRNKAFMTFVVMDREVIVGYFFLRSFVNGKCFRGRMVHVNQQGKGIGKLMSKAMTNVAYHLGLRMFCSISPENYASLQSAKAVNEIRIIKTLENGYYYIECTPKK